MAGESAETWNGIPKFGIRFLIPEDRREAVTRERFGELMVRGKLQSTDKEVLCLQSVVHGTCYDVTFRTLEDMERAYQRHSMMASPALLTGVSAVRWGDLSTVVVQVFNPHVLELDVRCYLGRYCAAMSTAERILDTNGFWTGKWKYRVRFRMSEDGARQLRPPFAFSLGPDRGRVFLPDLPSECWGCGGLGHLRSQCTVKTCLRCGVEGHFVKDCKELRACVLCGATNHLFAECPRRASYAGVVAGRPAGDRRSGAVGTSVPAAAAPSAPAGVKSSPACETVTRARGAEEPAVSGGGQGAKPLGSQDGRLVATATARPHGLQDGRRVTGAGERRADDWAEASASQEAEMAEWAMKALGAVKRPLRDGSEGGSPGTPVRRCKGVAGVPVSKRYGALQVEEGGAVSTVSEVAESSGEEESDGSSGSVLEGIPSPSPSSSGDLLGWDEGNLKRTTGMAD